MKPDAPSITEKAPVSLDLFNLYRSLLRIAENLSVEVAHPIETEYTGNNSDAESRRAEVFLHPDSANPASDESTSQG